MSAFRLGWLAAAVSGDSGGLVPQYALIYGYFAVTIGKLFFPTENETISLLLTLAEAT
jgi:MHS family proline/betaine transporter-like MFS transporter